MPSSRTRSLRLNDLRHASITHALASGENIRIIQERAGHSTPRLTLSVYAHALSGAHQATAQSMGNLLFADTGNARMPEVECKVVKSNNPHNIRALMASVMAPKANGKVTK